MPNIADRPGPPLSIVTPIYNGAHCVARSYQCLLDQTVVDWEWVVVDDGSTDGTSDVVRRLEDPRITLTTLPRNRGRGYARSHILDLCRGEWCVVWDVDDVHFPDRLAHVLEATADKLDFLCSYAALVDDNLNVVGTRGFFPPKAGFPGRFLHPTLSVRMEVVRRIGYDPRLAVGEDWYMVTALSAQYRGHFVPEALVGYYEIHDVGCLKALRGGVPRFRTVSRAFREGIIDPSFRELTAWRIRYAAKLAALGLMLPFPGLYRATVPYRSSGLVHESWRLSQDRASYLVWLRTRTSRHAHSHPAFPEAGS